MSPAHERNRIQVLDGGMGTTLESLGADVSTPLWGCDLLQTNPSVIQQVHQQFTQAGADLIQTATYQLTLSGLCSHAKVDSDQGGEIMRSAIPLASSFDENKGVVLSIGPFGATLSPSQEYKGVYPPPFGPSTTLNYISSDEEEKAIHELTSFHLSRLVTFSEDEEVWRRIDWIAFETIPLLTEYIAVRRAMGELIKMQRGKKFWISSAWPSGSHPQLDSTGQHVSVGQVLQAAIGGDEVPATAVGLNCTNPSYIKALATDFTQELKRIRKEGSVTEDVSFVLYPDGGSVYDTVTRTWSSGGLDPGSWGRQVSAVAKEVEEAEQGGEKVWSGVIVGGCCKSGFEEIKALSDALK